ncbi:MAG: hypothetical protein COB04_09660 [Gammaproteobacteria bacterium]|nr:MAG: hypothetical protein COB04_09660 [Gammaproteobacteria bacterium]
MSSYSNAVSSNTALGAAVIFCAFSLGSFLGLQLNLYLEVACAARGACYGNDGMIFTLSLIHPLVINLFFSSIMLAALSIPLIISIPFSQLRSAHLIDYTKLYEIKVLGAILLLNAALLLLLSFPLMIFFIGV